MLARYGLVERLLPGVISRPFAPDTPAEAGPSALSGRAGFQFGAKQSISDVSTAEGMAMSPYQSDLIAACVVAVACIAAMALTSDVAPDIAGHRVINPSKPVGAREAQSTPGYDSIFEILKSDRASEPSADSH